MVRPPRRLEDALDAARIPAQGPDQRSAAAVVAFDGRALLRTDRDQGSGAQRDARRQGRVGAGLSISMRFRRRGEKVGFQAAEHLGRRARAIAARSRRARGARQYRVGSAVDERPHDRSRPRRARVLGPGRLTTSYKRVSGDAVEYEVYARKTRAEPLHQVGSVVAPDDDLAAAYARATYDEERWIEIPIVRKAPVIALWQPVETSDP